MIETFSEDPSSGARTIEDMWRRKGELVAALDQTDLVK
jgi:hypothetical protein